MRQKVWLLLKTMKHRTILFVLTLIAFQSNAQIERDKTLHFGAGVISGAVGANIADELSDGNQFWILTGTLAGSLLAGFAKESLDQYQYGGWDNGDLIATVLGGVSVGITIELFSGKRKKIKQEVILVTHHRTMGTSITNTLDRFLDSRVNPSISQIPYPSRFPKD